MRILALDVGTSSVKAAVLEVKSGEVTGRPGRPGRPGSIARRHYSLDQATPETATLDAERLWQAVLDAGREAADGRIVEGLGLSCLSPGLILLGRNDEPLTPIITHLDRRSRPEARRIWKEVGPEFLASSGNRPLPGGISAVVFRHFARDEPSLAAQVHRYLHVNGWLALLLTGKTAFDRGNACFTGLYDALGARNWSPRWCDYFGVKQEWLPPVLSGDVTLGGLASDPARVLGVKAGIPVKLGTADTSLAMLAAGMGPMDLLHLVGTTQVLAVFAPQPQPSPDRLTRQLGVGDDFIYVTHNPVGGVALDWLRALCFREQGEQEFYEKSVSAALRRETPVLLDPPFLGGDRHQIEPRLAAFTNLDLASDRLDLLAAVLTAMRRGHAGAVAALGPGRGFRRVFLSGGGAELVRRLIPEYATQDVQLLEEASLRGVARLFG